MGAPTPEEQTRGPSSDSGSASTPFIIYTSAVLLFTNTLNYADRYILSVLAEPIKHDLGLSDADLGFLYGTSFVVLATIGGIAVGKVADTWLRNRLLSLGVTLWSGMTALSGFAVNFAQLALARVGVGIGEATATPVSYTLLTDVVPSRRRSLAFAVYLSGVNLGGALSLMIGGWLADHWHGMCGPMMLCGIRGWQSAFLLFGLLGILAAILVWFIGDPDARQRSKARPVKTGFSELSTLLPPFTFFQIGKLGGRRALLTNVIVAAGCAGLAVLISKMIGNPAQWAAVAISSYAVFSWCQATLSRDRDFYAAVVTSKAYLGVACSTALLAIVNTAITFWAVPYAVRNLDVTLSEAGLLLGLAIGLGALGGMALGGFVGDSLRKRTPLAALILMGVSVLTNAVGIVLLLTTSNMFVYTIMLTLFMGCSVLWYPSNVAVMQDFIPPHMRARAAAVYVVLNNLIGMSFGPYLVGLIGDALGGLEYGIASLLVLLPFVSLAIWFTSRHVPGAIAKVQREIAASNLP